MADASYAVSNFLGGEISAFAQGRFDKPDYRTSLNVCFNAFPAEIGPWVRRPGTMFAGTTRGGDPGRIIKFDFEQAIPYTLEFTDGFLRFRNGATLITTNDAQVVVGISTANPAVVQTTSATNWVTGNTLIFPGASTPLLENRQFIATKIDATHFSLADAITGANIDGSTLGALISGATVARVQELATVYAAGTWSTIRAVQAETTDILLTASIAPQALTVTTLPTGTAPAVFTINPAVFNDGPYLDPFTNGVEATPSALSGIINLTLAFPAWSSTTAYAKGSFVTASGINYVSLQDQNANQTPASSPTFWSPTSAGAAIGPNGFQATDIGRLVRLFSEPAPWIASSVYTTGNVVSYNPSGLPGATTYWQSIAASSNTGHAPGSDLTNWQIIPQGAAIWTWGKITGLSNIISRSLAGSSNIGNMAAAGGINAAFDGVFSKPFASSAELAVSSSGNFLQGQLIGLGGAYVGKNYSGATAQAIKQATIYPSSDAGLVFGTYLETSSGLNQPFSTQIILTLRAKQTVPTSPSDGIALGTTGPGFISNQIPSITITSNDQVTAWNYVWIEVEAQAAFGGNATSYTLAGAIGQVSFFSPSSTGTGDGVTVEILGPPLLYTNPVITWRIGAYSDTTGWPTCGCYDDGRLWLGGAIPNRFDASTSNGIVPGSSVVNFAPTDQYGVVAASNGISETINSDGTNPIEWMEPDLQGIICGTQAGEFLILAPTSGSIAPNNISVRRATRIGVANVEPRRTEHTLVFVQRYGVKLMEYFADVFSGKFSAPNLADKAQHITRAGIAEIAYQSATTPIVWGRDTLNALFGMTYKRDTLTTSQGPTFYAWHRHGLGSGRVVESLTVGPSVGGNLDSLTMITNDPATGIRHVEVLTDLMDEDSSLTSAWFLDDAVNPTSFTPSNGVQIVLTPAPGWTILSQFSDDAYGGVMLNGLSHLNGKTVQVFAGGLDCGYLGEQKPFSDFVVTNGSIFIPWGDGISSGSGAGLFTADFLRSLSLSQIVVGFTYTSQGQLVRPMAQADTGARNGPAFGKLGRAHRYALKLVNTLGLTIGANFARKMYGANFKQNNNSPLPPLTMFNGTSQDTLQDDYTYDDSLCWQVTRPYPASVVIAGTNRATQDQ